jgi:hypothetical protein
MQISGKSGLIGNEIITGRDEPEALVINVIGAGFVG